MTVLPPAALVSLRIGLHALVAVLAVLTVVRAYLTSDSRASVVLVLTVVFVATYGLCRRPAWLAVLMAQWLALVSLTPEAAYLVFPLFFVLLLWLPGWPGPVAVLAAAVVAVVALGWHGEFTVGGVIGPLIAALVAIAMGLGYRAQRELAHERGVLAERARLAAEIHDTVAQGLSSIQMLLHAAERAQPDAAGIEHVRLARETAADSLAEARRFVRDLTPAMLAGSGLVGALRRAGSAGRVRASLTVTGRPRELPMPVETALLRIAQGALSNVDKHAGTDQAMLSLAYLDDGVRMEVADSGTGFDPATVAETSAGDSFGLEVMRGRLADLGGTLDVRSSPGGGTRIVATVGASA